MIPRTKIPKISKQDVISSSPRKIAKSTSYRVKTSSPLLQHTNIGYRQLRGNPAGVYVSLLSTRLFLAPSIRSGMLKLLSSGLRYSAVVKSDGTIWDWGYNSTGQLGDGTRNDVRLTPVQVHGLNHVVDLACGGAHTLAVDASGNVWAWGYNASHQLGTADTQELDVPTKVEGLTGVKMVAAGHDHSMALKTDGSIWVWGSNQYGQLANGTLANDSTGTPRKVQSDQKFVAIDAGFAYCLAIDEQGDVWTWGSNTHGQLGDGSKVNRATPTKIAVTKAVAVAGGHFHSLVLRKDGTVVAFSSNNNGQLGIGPSIAEQATPTQVPMLDGVIDIAASTYNNNGTHHSLVLKKDGTIWAFGANDQGQLGNGTTTNSSTPVQVSGITNGAMISAGGAHSLALLSDGKVQAWGWNLYGQVGDGTTENRNKAIPTVAL